MRRMFTKSRGIAAYAVTGALAMALSATAPVILAQSSPALAAEKTTDAKEQGIVDSSRATIAAFASDKQITWVRDNMKNAHAVIILPEQVKGGFMVGGSGGTGVALSRTADGTWSSPAFVTMGSITFGLQAGGQVSEIVLMAMTEKGAQALKGDSFKLGGDVSVAAGPVGAGAKGQLADVVAFSRSKGLYGGLNVEGAMIKSRAAMNTAYYGEDVSMASILEGKVTNAKADGLRAALTDIEKGSHAAMN